MLEAIISAKSVSLFPSAGAGAPLVVLNGEGDEGERVCAAAREATDADFSLAVIGGIDWDDELTPWPCPSPFKGAKPFGGGADGYLNTLIGEIISGITALLPAAPAYVALAGYSLAGLFALYATYRTHTFARVASASGSLWYPDWMEFVENHGWQRRPERVYLSLGDREGRTRNPVMRPVEENTRRLAALYDSLGIPAEFEMNPGGHFDAPDLRMARGIARLVTD